MCSKHQCDDEQVNSVYLWEEVEAAQAADDAVDLGEPPAFAARLKTATKKKNQNQNTEVSQDCSSNNTHGIRAVEQSKALWTDALKLQPEEKPNVFRPVEIKERRIKAGPDQHISNKTYPYWNEITSNSESKRFIPVIDDSSQTACFHPHQWGQMKRSHWGKKEHFNRFKDFVK